MGHFNLITQLRRWTLVLLLLAPFAGAWATTCTGGNQTFTLSLPSTVSVARDAPVGSLLTNWVSSAKATNLFNCTLAQADSVGSLATLGPSLSVSSGTTYVNGGVTYTVWNTSVPGIGIAVGASVYISSSACTAGRGWYPWLSLDSRWGGWNCGPSAGTSGPIGTQIQVALVKTGPVTAGGTISGITVAQAGPSNGQPPSVAFSGQLNSYVITPVAIVPMTCTTPDVNVPMGTFKTADFPAIGSLSPGQAAPVNIQLLNCPGGAAVSGTQAGQIHSIQYRIDPTAGTLATNVAALTGTPSATGVGIQLFTASGGVFPLSTLQTLSGYNSATGGNYTIPLTARYYRTGPVTAGPADTAMTLTISYQ